MISSFFNYSNKGFETKKRSQTRYIRWYPMPFLYMTYTDRTKNPESNRFLFLSHRTVIRSRACLNLNTGIKSNSRHFRTQNCFQSISHSSVNAIFSLMSFCSCGFFYARNFVTLCLMYSKYRSLKNLVFQDIKLEPFFKK